MKKLAYFLILLFLFACNGKKKNSEKEITVFAAASLTNLITDLTAAFQEESGVQVKLNVAASGTLARQIEQGAEADVFLSANKNWKNYLVDKGKTKESSVFARNDLVLVSSVDKSYQFEKVDSLFIYINGKIAVGDPGYVPVGKYASQVFSYYKLNLNDKLYLCQNVRAALMMVELGEAELGIVYKTDALQSKKVKIVYTFPAESHDSVEYHQVLISDKRQAKYFYKYLNSDEAQKILTKYSFIIN